MTGISFVIFMLTFIDQLFKSWAYNVTVSGDWVIVPQLFRITYVENTGIAFNMLAGSRWMIVAMSAVVLLVIAFAIFTKRVTNEWIVSGLSLILAGGLSNLIDRASRGFVIDCFAVFNFPVFNIADGCVCLGAAMIVYYFWLVEPKEKKQKALAGIAGETISPVATAELATPITEIIAEEVSEDNK